MNLNNAMQQTADPCEMRFAAENGGRSHARDAGPACPFGRLITATFATSATLVTRNIIHGMAENRTRRKGAGDSPQTYHTKNNTSFSSVFSGSSSAGGGPAAMLLPGAVCRHPSALEQKMPGRDGDLIQGRSQSRGRDKSRVRARWRWGDADSG